MTHVEKLTMLKALVGGSDTDEVLSAYLTIAGRKIIDRAYPYRAGVVTVPHRYSCLQVEIAAYLLNKRGAEGEVTHTENGITRQYESADVPESMLRSITPHVGVFFSEAGGGES